jgi:hypothetical protein
VQVRTDTDYLAFTGIRYPDRPENRSTQLIFSNYFSPENRTVYEIMSKNVVEPERLQIDACALHVG